MLARSNVSSYQGLLLGPIIELYKLDLLNKPYIIVYSNCINLLLIVALDE